jgi:hypothetical protein
VKYWEIIADNLSKAGWSWGCVSALDAQRRTIWIADAHRDDGKRFAARADEKLTAFVELERAIYEFAMRSYASNTLPASSQREPWRYVPRLRLLDVTPSRLPMLVDLIIMTFVTVPVCRSSVSRNTPR